MYSKSYPYRHNHAPEIITFLILSPYSVCHVVEHILLYQVQLYSQNRLSHKLPLHKIFDRNESQLNRSHILDIRTPIHHILHKQFLFYHHHQYHILHFFADKAFHHHSPGHEKPIYSHFL